MRRGMWLALNPTPENYRRLASTTPNLNGAEVAWQRVGQVLEDAFRAQETNTQ